MRKSKRALKSRRQRIGHHYNFFKKEDRLYMKSPTPEAKCAEGAFEIQSRPGRKLGNLGNVGNLGNFFLLFFFRLFNFGLILKIENSKEENSEKQFRHFWPFRHFRVFDLPLFDLTFSSDRLRFFHVLWAFLFSFLTLFEFVILGYWTAIIQHANLCSKSYK